MAKKNKNRYRKQQVGELSSAKVLFFPRSLGRDGYFVRSLAVFGLALVLIVLHNFLFGLLVGSPKEQPELRTLDGAIFFGWIAILYLYHMAFFMSARMKDIGLPRFTAFIGLIPYAGQAVALACLLIPSDALK